MSPAAAQPIKKLAQFPTLNYDFFLLPYSPPSEVRACMMQKNFISLACSNVVVTLMKYMLNTTN